MRRGTKERPSAPMGEAVKTRRREKHMTQKQLADAIGVDRVTVARIESGEQKTVNERTRDGLSRALGMMVAELKQDYYTKPTPAWLSSFLESRWNAAIETSDEEISWLRSLGLDFWDHAAPSPDDVADEIQTRRKRRSRRMS